MSYKVIIIGGGPAGLACALQLKRYNIESLVIEKNNLGGLMRNANKIENYLGFPDGISGIELCDKYLQQIKNNNINIVFDEVLNLQYKKNEFIFQAYKKTFTGKIAVIASGTNANIIQSVEIEKKVSGKVHYEVFPLANISNKNISIIGAGDAAFDYAITLSKKNNVNIFNRSNKVKCLPLLYNKVSTIKNIKYHTQLPLKSVKEKKGKLSLIFNDNKKIDEHISDYIIFAAGRKPEQSFLSNINESKINNLVSTKKLFFIGDVKNGIARQLAIATGDGVKAAMEIKDVLGV